MATLTFAKESEALKFLTTALPNCIFEDVHIPSIENWQLLSAIGQAADSIIVKGSLRTPYGMHRDGALDLVRKFRNVKVSHRRIVAACPSI